MKATVIIPPAENPVAALQIFEIKQQSYVMTHRAAIYHSTLGTNAFRKPESIRSAHAVR
jgi:hypothetical protein